MKYRETELLDQTDVGASGTKSIDINVLDPISRIDITWRADIKALMLTQPGAMLPKIELVDGSDVLFSMSGLEAQALNIYDRRVPTMNSPLQCAGNMGFFTFGIDFGRWLWDTELAFDPKQFRNPQLKITYNETLTWVDCANNFLEVVAHCFDEKIISPIGFLMSKLHYAYEPVGDDSYHYIDLPTDHTIRQMLIRGYKSQKNPLDVVDEARLSEENDKRVVFDLELTRYFYRMAGVWPAVKEFWQEYSSTTEARYCKYFTPTNFMSIVTLMPQWAVGRAFHQEAPRGGYFDWRADESLMWYGVIEGYLPNHSIQIPFGVQSELDSWYEAQLKGSVRLRLYASTEFKDSLVSVILQQLRRY